MYITLFLPAALWRWQAPTVMNGASSHKIDYITQVEGILNVKGYKNVIIGLKETAIFLIGWNLPIGGVAWGRVCTCSMRSRLVLTQYKNIYLYINIY